MRCQAVLEALARPLRRVALDARLRARVARRARPAPRLARDRPVRGHGRAHRRQPGGRDRAAARRVRRARHARRRRRCRPGRRAARARAPRSRATSTRPIAWRPRARSSRARTSRPRSRGASRAPRCSRRVATSTPRSRTPSAAVEIAAATDLILDHADACVALAQTPGTRGRRGRRAAGARATRSASTKRRAPPCPPNASGRTLGACHRGRTGATTRRGAGHRATTHAHRSPRTPRRGSQARIYELLLAGRLDEARALFADDYVRIDRRSVVSMPTQGVDGISTTGAIIADLGITAIDFEPIAVRGDRLFLEPADVPLRTRRHEHAPRAG